MNKPDRDKHKDIGIRLENLDVIECKSWNLRKIIVQISQIFWDSRKYFLPGHASVRHFAYTVSAWT